MQHPTVHARLWLTCTPDDRQARRRRRLEHRDRGPHHAEPCTARRGRARVPRGVQARRTVTVVVDATLPEPHRRIASARRSRTPSTPASSSRRRPVRSAAATRSSCRSPTGPTRSCCPTTRSRSSTAQYAWLFDQGRLIGGKPVPHVGWVFMERSPVRGPAEPRSVSDAKKAAKTAAPAKAAADGRSRRRPPTRGRPRRPHGAQRPRPRRRRQPRPQATAAQPAPARKAALAATPSERRGRRPATARRGGGAGGVEPYNEALPFIEFVVRPPRRLRRSRARSSGSRRTAPTSSSTARGATCR